MRACKQISGEMIRIQKEMQRIKGLEKSIDLIINGIR